MSTNKRVRFMATNWMENSNTIIAASSENSSFPIANLTDQRYKAFRFEGNFTIDSTNNSIYINDGLDKTCTLISGDYAGGAALAAQIQTRLNAVSSNWTVTYSTTTYKFTIANSGSVTLRLSVTTNSTWDDIGFNTGTNRTGTSFEADNQRIHTNEWISFDLRTSVDSQFFTILPEINGQLKFSGDASLTLKGSNVNTGWGSPPYSKALSVNAEGVYQFLDSVSIPGYRFWRLEIIDRTNINGPALPLNFMFLGPYETTTAINVVRGFSHQDADETTVVRSESGVKYFNVKSKRKRIGGLEFPFLENTDYKTIRDLFKDLGLNQRFLFSVDPTLCFSDNLYDLTYLVFLDDSPTFTNNGVGRYSASFSVSEVS